MPIGIHHNQFPLSLDTHKVFHFFYSLSAPHFSATPPVFMPTTVASIKMLFFYSQNFQALALILPQALLLNFTCGIQWGTYFAHTHLCILHLQSTLFLHHLPSILVGGPVCHTYVSLLAFLSLHMLLLILSIAPFDH